MAETLNCDSVTNRNGFLDARFEQQCGGEERETHEIRYEENLDEWRDSSKCRQSLIKNIYQFHTTVLYS